jgi:hypothetical protein
MNYEQELGGKSGETIKERVPRAGAQSPKVKYAWYECQTNAPERSREDEGDQRGIRRR